MKTRLAIALVALLALPALSAAQEREWEEDYTDSWNVASHTLTGEWAAQTAYDIVVLDPPAFAKSRKSKETALRGYADVNRLAMRHLAPGGVLVACSCSHHVPREDFMEALRFAARDARRQFRVLPERAGPPADHAPLLSTPETDYLKMVVLADQPDVGEELKRRGKEA